MTSPSTRFFSALVALSLALGAGACSAPSNPPSTGPGAHSSSLVLNASGSSLYVVNPEADSVSFLDTQSRALVREVLLAPAHPVPDAQGNYVPSVLPRSVALSPDGATLYVSGERSGMLYALDTASGTVRGSVSVGSEPAGIVLSPDGNSVYVAVSQDGLVKRVDTRSLTVVATASLGDTSDPWALALSADGTQLLVTHLVDAVVTVLDPTSLAVLHNWPLPDIALRSDRRLANGKARGLFDLAVRPGTTDAWVSLTLLATDTAQPQLDFESTAFPGVAVLRATGTVERTLSTDAPNVPGPDGAFSDVVSGPHALAFTRDGQLALMVDSNSEDVLAIDAVRHTQSGLLRPLPGHTPEGIVLSPDEQFAYIDERNTLDVAVVRVTRSATGVTMAVDGAAIPRVSADPMPASLRMGDLLFHSANSDQFAITRNHWIACATCHMEGRSDAVTWRFLQGPRDTPSNAGGVLGTGFLHRTADRYQVQDYWHTINDEQGGHFNNTDPALVAQLDRIAEYVNHGIPLPIPPTLDAGAVARGSEIFHRPEVGCATCHSGPRFTDSGAGNPTLDLSGVVLLHDVGTCVIASDFPDVAHADVDGHPRDACQYDTPSLNGVSASPPYLHDGSAADLLAVLNNTRGRMGNIAGLSPTDLNDLVAYLRSL